MAHSEFRIGTSPGIGVQVAGIIAGHMELVQDLCSGREKDDLKAIHEIRKSFKRSRALLRLIRDAMGYANYYRENTAIRENHRLLSHARDLTVLNATMRKMHRKYPDLISNILFDDIIDLIISRQQLEIRSLKQLGVFETIRKNMDDPIDRMNHYGLQNQGFDAIERGMKRVYRKGRQALGEAFGKESTPGKLHDFRKKGKYLYYQLDVLRPLFPKVLKGYAHSLEQMTDLLGDYNDLVRAEVAIPKLFDGQKYPGRSISTLFSLFREERARLERRSALLASNVYAETPDLFVSRMRSYWETYMMGIKQLT